MSIVETWQLPRAVANGSEKIYVCCTAARPTGMRTKECERETTDAELLARAIEDRTSGVLRCSSWHPLRQVSCEVREGMLVLRGRVPNFYMKQIAQTMVRDLLSDGLIIDNRVEVDRT